MRQYRDLMQLVLLGAAIVSIVALQEFSTGLVIIGLTVLNAVLGLNQEGKAAESVAALQKMLVIRAHVRRGGAVHEVPAEELVPGDVVGFEAGDKIPADGRLLVAATLEIEEAALTGESTPVSKAVDPVPGDSVPLGDRVDLAYMNSTVTRGRGEMVVTTTGMGTEVGRISGMLAGVQSEKTPLTRQLDQLTVLLTIMAAGALALVVVIGLLRGDDFDELFLIGISLAVAAIPTGLPAVVTTVLSLGTQALAAKGAIVKRLRSVETLGSTSAICSDKTGTLTLNQMTARQLVIAGRRYSVDGEGYSTNGRILHVAGEPDVPLDTFLLPMALANDATVETARSSAIPPRPRSSCSRRRAGSTSTRHAARIPGSARCRSTRTTSSWRRSTSSRTTAGRSSAASSRARRTCCSRARRGSATSTGPSPRRRASRPGPRRERPPRGRGAARPGGRRAGLRPDDVRRRSAAPRRRPRPDAARARGDRRPAAAARRGTRSRAARTRASASG